MVEKSFILLQEEIDFSPIRRSPEGSHKSKQGKSPFPEAERPIIMRETRNTRSRWREILHNPHFQEQVTISVLLYIVQVYMYYSQVHCM